MKKIITFIISLIMIFSLASCSIGESPRSVDEYEYISAEKTDEELQSALSKVEDSSVIVSYASSRFSNETYISGVIYKHANSRYYVLTSSDVANVSSIGSVIKVYFDSKTYINASIIGYDKQNNIGIVSFNSLNTYTVANLINYNPTVGEEVFSISTYKHQGDLEESYYDLLHKGIISRYDSLQVQHTALSSENECGSPLFDYDGNLIGISTQKLVGSNSERVNGMNYAIYGSGLQKIIEDINFVQGSVGRYNFSSTYTLYNTYLDTSVNLTSDIKTAIHISSITRANTFYRILQSGDYIYKINDYEFIDAQDFTNKLYLLRTDETVSFMIYRNNKSISVSYN